MAHNLGCWTIPAQFRNMRHPVSPPHPYLARRKMEPRVNFQTRLQTSLMRLRRLLRVQTLLTLAAATTGGLSSGAQAQANGLWELSIEQLSQVRITTVSRTPEPRAGAAAAVHVITREEILRSGVRNIPEALRLAPGVEVSRLGTGSWSITMRGFNNDLSNKLLVLIDGRSVYSPLFAGVFWDVQDTFITDIERIEVIGGPGGALWGANAVNGVINIITRPTSATEGGSAQITAGNTLNSAALRFGGLLSSEASARGYVKKTEGDDSKRITGGDAFDAWELAQSGFRVDWDRDENDSITVQGDIYRGEKDSMLRSDFTLGTLPFEYPGSIEVAGHNLLTRWDHALEEGSSVRLQAYLDHTRRDIPGTYNEKRTTVDVDFQHTLPRLNSHQLVWGAAYRRTRDELDNTTFATSGDSLRDVHVLVVEASRMGRSEETLEPALLNSTLTVTESEISHSQHSIINMEVIDGRVLFDVSLPAAESARLAISARLLQVARQVIGENL